jgi:hypothetical protein
VCSPVITAFFVAAFCLAALVLITLAITGRIPRVVWIVGLCLSIVAIVLALVVRQAMAPEEKSGEVLITREYAASVRADGFPITVERAFEASSFGGFHGDGASVTAYRYPPAESDTLVSALKRREPTFVWNDVLLRQHDFSTLRHLLPPDFLPAPDTSTLLVGSGGAIGLRKSPAEGPPVQEFAVDRSRGILYVIRNQF